jgi:metallophosphoesterase superfamily enzyme
MCDWCGHDHPAAALCAARPKWGRRGFLALAGAALVGSVLPAAPVYYHVRWVESEYTFSPILGTLHPDAALGLWVRTADIPSITTKIAAQWIADGRPDGTILAHIQRRLRITVEEI